MKNNLFRAFCLLLMAAAGPSCNLFGADKWDGPTRKSVDSRYYLHTGFLMDAVLLTGIHSFNLATPVIAATEADVIYQGRIMVPKGTKFMGTAAVVKSGDRVNVTFHTMVFPNGQEIPFQGVALDPEGKAGLRGKVKKQRAALPAQVIVGSVGAAVTAATGQNVAGDLAQAVSEETKAEIAEKQTYSVEVQGSVPLQIYVNSRVEY